jgi:hypothetical protein
VKMIFCLPNKSLGTHKFCSLCFSWINNDANIHVFVLVLINQFVLFIFFNEVSDNEVGATEFATSIRPTFQCFKLFTDLYGTNLS